MGPPAQPSPEIVGEIPRGEAEVALFAPLIDVDELMDDEARQVVAGSHERPGTDVDHIGKGDGGRPSQHESFEPRFGFANQETFRVDGRRNCRQPAWSDVAGFERLYRREVVAHVQRTAHLGVNVAPRLRRMEVRIIDEGDVDDFITVLENTFGFEAKEERRQEFLKQYELDRLFAVFDDDAMVATGGAFSFDLTVPGGSVPCAGTTLIAVLPTHRRRGVLTRMMTFHFDEVASRGEPVAALWASEAPIYGRFGYGVASHFFRTKVTHRRLDFPHPALGSGAVRLVDRPVAEQLFPGLYEKIRAVRPGFLTRTPARWEWVHFHDPPEWRDGGTPRRYAVYEEAGEALGYVGYRQRENWDEGLPANVVSMGPMHALTPAAEEGLWRYLGGIDLVGTIEAWNGDPASILPHIVSDARRVTRRISDGMWVRILDVPASLSARRYAVDGSLTIELTDPFRQAAAGVFRLTGGPEGAVCEPSAEPPDLRMDVRELGSLYLGGVSASDLARSGLIAGDEAAVRRADLMFGWHVPPWCPEVF